MMRDGHVDLPSQYGDAPYRFTRKLIEDGRRHLVMDKRLADRNARCGCCKAWTIPTCRGAPRSILPSICPAATSR